MSAFHFEPDRFIFLFLALNICRVFINFGLNVNICYMARCAQLTFFFIGFKCPVCSKFVSSDEMDLHLVMCLTKPRITYNGKKEVS